MSREIDPMDLSERDIAYIKQRPMLRREFILQGYGDPLSEDYDPEKSLEEFNKANEEAASQRNSEAPSPASEPTVVNGSETVSEDPGPGEAQSLEWDEKMKKDELQKIADARGLEVEGSGEDGKVLKQDLIDALSEADEDDES